MQKKAVYGLAQGSAFQVTAITTTAGSVCCTQLITCPGRRLGNCRKVPDRKQDVDMGREEKKEALSISTSGPAAGADIPVLFLAGRSAQPEPL
jgi:hypothetical protein